MTARTTCRQLLRKYASHELSLSELLRTSESIDISGQQLLAAVEATAVEAKERIAELQISQNAYASKVGMNASTISRAIAGASMPLSVSLEMLGMTNQQYAELSSAAGGDADPTTAAAPGGSRSLQSQGSTMDVDQLSHEQLSRYLTRARVDGAQGAMTALFYFKSTQLQGIDLGAISVTGEP